MEHYYHTIQNWFDYQEVFKLAVDRAQDGFKFVEIGVWKGGSTSFMGVEIYNSGKQISYDAIDTFEGSQEHGVVYPYLYEEAYANLKPLIDLNVINLIKGNSLDVVSKYEDNSLDFVFIDGSHEYEDVKADILAYLPKVKVGGILAGHDYDNAWQGVVKAVNETLGENNITTIKSAYQYEKS
jgi:predicted O-methyltransferase YrrM